MAMLSEVIDAVIGADTHRDTDEVEIAYPSGAVIATGSFGNHRDGSPAGPGGHPTNRSELILGDPLTPTHGAAKGGPSALGSGGVGWATVWPSLGVVVRSAEPSRAALGINSVSWSLRRVV